MLEGQNPKIFMVQDPDQGSSVLEEEKLQYTVTGGTVQKCGQMVL
jgi:hypothetical protein